MAGAKFDSKSFNPQAFGHYLSRIPQLRKNALIKSGILTGNVDIKNAFSSQTGTAYAILPFYGLLGGDVQNYDGETDLITTNTTTYERGVVVTGRMQGWTERDFSYDITGKVDFMDNVAAQVSEYFDHIDQSTLLAILSGIFAMDDTDFTENHTLDISEDATPTVGATTLNNAIQKAGGDNKNIFTLAIMHSVVATNLENLKLVEYAKYTDEQNIQRDLALATWNGRTVIIDDEMPFDSVTGAYTTYILGRGAFDYEDIGVKVPTEMYRDPAKFGGVDALYVRQRKVFAPYGISYIKANQASLSPKADELSDGSNWELVNDGNGNTINHKAIPICRIISQG